LQPIDGIRVIKFNTLLRVVYTLGVSLILSQFATAQSAQPQGSVLNFIPATVNQSSDADFVVTNPTPNYADVTFTFYGFDGNPASGAVLNPVRERVAPRGQISVRATDLFAVTGSADGWVQVTSSTAGITGTYLLGDFAKTLGESPAVTPSSDQVIPLIRQDSTSTTQVVVANPSTGSANFTITFYDPTGKALGNQALILGGHAATRILPSAVVLNLPAQNISARISSSLPVSATAIIDRGSAQMFAGGQSLDQLATVLVAPHFASGGGFNPVLVLANPNGSPVTVSVTLFGQNGGSVDPSLTGPSTANLTIPANGSVSATMTDIIGRSLSSQATINGWIKIFSPNVALGSLLILDQGDGFTAVPLQTNPQGSMLFSEIVENPTTDTALALTNATNASIAVDVFLMRQDGATLSQNSITIGPNSRSSNLVRYLLPDVLNQAGSYVFVRSSAPLFGVALTVAQNAFVLNDPAAPATAAFVPSGVFAPSLYVSGADVQSGGTVEVTVAPSDSVTSILASDKVVFMIGQQALTAQQLSPFSTFDVNLPSLSPGFTNLYVRFNGVDSLPVALHVLPSDHSATQNISGTALYQKIDVTDAGLDLAHPVMFPIRHGRVEVINPASQTLVSVSETDVRGHYTVAVPPVPGLTVRVLSQLQSYGLSVEDNTNGGALYAISQNNVDGRSPASGLLLVDNTRVSGAYNILEVIQRANDTVKSADPTLPPIPVTIFWSTNNKNISGNPAQGLIGTSEFNLANNTAYILGDIKTDSDEYDDAVIAHEYGHMLAAKYSRDDSPGGPHSLGDRLDPRVAWSEGWANFFSSAVRNDPIWRDSMGPNGSQVLRYDLSDSSLAGDPRPGYWSEASVDTMLWALEAGLDADNVQYPFSSIWGAFTDLKSNSFVYLPYFLDHFISRVSASTPDIISLAQSHSIDYQPGAVPSVTNPFPMPISVGVYIGPDSIDSYTPKRTNLITSAHFYTFTTTGGATTITMNITGLGPANNPNANDLDLFLYNANGQLMDVSDSGGNGQSERIADRLGAGTYVVEVRSYYTNGNTGSVIYSSGDYKLSVSVQ
jgi:hypothetical protein